MKPLIFKKDIPLFLPTEDDKRSVVQGVKDASGIDSLIIPIYVLRKISYRLREKDKTFSCIIGQTDRGYRIVDLAEKHSYSIALDLGTTNLVASLYDNIEQSSLVTMSFENPQIDFGSDILTRMHHAMSPARAGEVYQSLLKGLNGFIDTLCRASEIDKQDIHAMVVAGNTVMTHFFLGLDISTIPVDPFVPVVKKPGFFSASELSLDINPDAIVYVFPNAGSYVGGDAVAGILASGIYRSDEPCILIDVGTNAEVVVGNKDWMLVGAGAAGPALEEGISMIGKRAKEGIIYDVEMRDGSIICKTFDNAKPEGICGSGMVSLIYEMYKSGLIDRSGTLNPGRINIIRIDGEQAFRISCNSHDALYIRQSEINNFLKSKAALFTLLLVLTRSVGIGFRDVKSVSVAGALGTGINVRKAIGLGMLPEWPEEIIKPFGNTSLAGAQMIIENGDLVDAVDSITDKITYKHMHDDPEFMKEFMGAVFIPHTNLELLKI